MKDDLDENVKRRLEQRVGTLLRHRYLVERLIGVGGMAAVYAGSHRNGNHVAIKVLHPELALSKDMRERFLREGYAANRVAHPGAVRVLDDDVTEDDSVFLVMELLEGETFEQRIAARGGTVPPSEAIPIAIAVLDVLNAAHEKGIVHRDIKPENVFIDRHAAVKVLDFGIARLNDAGRQSTRTGALMGTPVYMAPEQARGEVKTVTGQTDIFAVGAMLFRALTGRYVHEAETAQMSIIHAATKPAPRLRDVIPTAPTELAEIVDRSLAFGQGERWKTAAAMATALRGLRGEELSSSRIVSAPTGSGGEKSDDVTTLPTPERARAMRRGAELTDLLFDEDTEMGEPLPQPVAPAKLAPGQSTTGGVARSAASVTTRTRAPLLLGGVALLVLVGGFALTRLISFSRPDDGAPSAPGSVTSPASTTSEPPVEHAPSAEPAATGEPAAAPSLRETPPPVSSAVVDAGAPRTAMTSYTAPSPSSGPTGATSARALTSASSALAQPPPPAGSCASPFYTDAQGTKRVRAECLR